jgi:hypothetical protein
VEVKSVESIHDTYPGSNLRDEIRAHEQARWLELGPRLQYVLLVGPHSVIPFAWFAVTFNGYDGSHAADLDACLAAPQNSNVNWEGLKLKFSDWTYADLTSNFDPNGNGCLLDGIAADPVEDPFAPGYIPDARPAFQPTVAVGRIPLRTAQAVRDALANSMAAEGQSLDYKGRVLQAMSMPFLQGQYWSPEDSPSGAYYPCPGEGQANKNCWMGTADAAYVAEYARSAFLDSLDYQSTTLYETAKPPGASPAGSTLPLTADNVAGELQARAYGLVNLAGHGGADGVGRTFWVNQNSNGTVESPTSPIGGESKDEISGDTLLDKARLSGLTPHAGRAGVYFAAACATGAPTTEDNFGATLLQDGHSVAWVGGVSGISVGPWVDPSDGNILSVQYYVMEKMLKGDLRLGDAVWQTLARQAKDEFSGSPEIATDLYGDPTFSYWGNPGGGTTLAAWPMLRQNAQGLGYTPLAGPQVPRKLWEYAATAPGTTTLYPSPVVSNNGEVIVAHGSYVDVLRQGALYQRLYLDDPAFGTPALSADGTLYALDTAGRLYAFAYPQTVAPGGNPLLRFRRWSLALGYMPTTSPVVGADGFVAVGGYSSDGSVTLVRPDGVIAETYGLHGMPMGALAVGADRAVYVASTTGYVGRIDFFCAEQETCVQSGGSSLGITAPPLVAYGNVYVGHANGDVEKLALYGLNQLAVFHAGTAITAGPVAGPGGQVLVGTAGGSLFSLTEDTLSVRWQRELGAPVGSVPAFSADALYVVSGDALRAYEPFSGAPMWSRSLGSGVAPKGSAAVGYGREVYVQASGGKISAFSEGWQISPYHVAAYPVLLTGGVRAIQVEWAVTAPGPVGSSEDPAALAGAAPLGVLLQRSTAAADWQDLPLGTAASGIYTDTEVLDNVRYSYRAQVLDAEGNDSDFTGVVTATHSLPAPPTAPALQFAKGVAADAIQLGWRSPGGDVVKRFRLERRLASGAFLPIAEVGGAMTVTLDSGLTPNTAYEYRLVALNDAGESPPSATERGVTFSRGLKPPQNVKAALLDGGGVQIGWDPGPDGVSTVIEFTEAASSDYLALATWGAAGPFVHYPGEPNIYVYRLKFVRGTDESAWAETPAVVIARGFRAYLPVVMR